MTWSRNRTGAPSSVANKNTLTKWFCVTATSLLSFSSAAYAAIAYQAAKAAAAMPFAVGGFDERHFWWPLGMAVFFILLTTIALVTKW